MKKLHWVDWVTLGVILLLTALYALTLPDIPFHPDESTHIYMSEDISQNPLTLAWDGALPLGSEERIRAIDAPLAKYLIGAVREIFSISPLGSDWNWALGWEENQSQGALPTTKQLLFSRSVMTLVLPFSLWLLYLTFKKIMSSLPSLVAVTLLGLSPLLLLHARRAMSEGLLVFGIALLLWAVTRDKRNPWLIGLALGIAINAKLSALGLFPAAILAVVILPEGFPGIKKGILNILKSLFIVLIAILLLNPFYWKHPLSALEAGLKARFSLAEEQQEDYLGRLGLDEQPLMTTIPGLILNTYLTPPQTEEVGNYLAQTGEAKERYLSNPFHNWGRDLISGSILAAISFAGLGFAFWRFQDKDPWEKNNILIIALAALGMGIFTIILLPWQRYVLAILPFTFCWVGFGLAPIFKALQLSPSESAPVK